MIEQPSQRIRTALKPGDKVSLFGHHATVVHVFEHTANIRFDAPLPRQSPQIDVWIESLTRLA